MIAKIETLSRYPVKGLSGQTLERVSLTAGDGIPGDRQFGFARPQSGFDPDNPGPLPKSKFYMLARDASLALLNTAFDDKTGMLSIGTSQTEAQFEINTAEGKHSASQFLKTYLNLADKELPVLYEASPHRFTDVSVVSTEMMNAVSIINLDSVQAFSKTLGQEVDPGRFRANLIVSGLSPFSELEMVGQQISIGEVKLNIVMRTKRCPATEVDLHTGERNMNIPALLQKYYDHKDMGIYAQVIEGGTISTGDTVQFP